MVMASEESADRAYIPTYRQQDVDETLDRHEQRLTRLEKGALIAVGYVLGTASLNAADLLRVALQLP